MLRSTSTLLGEEMRELATLDLDLGLAGFEQSEIDSPLAIPDEERANATPPVPANPVSLRGDCGSVAPTACCA